MIPINFSKREKYVLIAAIVFIAAALLYNFILEPGVKKWRLGDMEILAKKIKISKGVRLLERRDSIVREYNKYAKASKNIAQILSDMENLADSSGIRTSNMKPGQAIDKELYTEYMIELQIEGQLPDIAQFFSELVKLPTLVVLKRYDFRLISQNPPIFKGTIVLSKIII